ncbi:MAG: hypothetical protein ABFS12_13885 [Bacteroidota bacterium]
MQNLKLFFIVIILFLISSIINAQRVEITPYYGYMFAGKMTLYQGDFNVKNNGNYGITLDFEVDRRAGIFFELLYDRLDTRAVFKKYPTNITTNLFDMSEEYFQVGGLYNHQLKKNISTFGVFTLGATRFHPKDSRYGDDWRFSVTLGGGLKVFISEKIGFRFQGRIKMPLYFAGGGIWIGSGGVNYGLGAGTALLQADLNAGLIFRIGK